jgi:putative oxidoreductase
MAYGLLLLRVFVGAAFFGHGTQKLFGWWGGYGPQGTGGFFASQGYRWGVPMAVIAGLTEAGGGTLLALGLATPLACGMIAVVMLNAIFSVTLKRAFMAGSELELTYLVTVVALAAIGRDDNISGLWWGVAAIAAAAAVSFVTLTFFRSRTATQAAPQA